jgi:prepilin-type N-terminal cleavage/methylation domain-containing protein
VIPRRRSPSRLRGFTLPEVLAALLLAAIVLPVVLRGVSLSMFASVDARHRLEAISLAETKLAELSGSSSSTMNGSSGGDFGPDYPLFRWSSTASSVDTDLSEIRVRVSWTARGQEQWIDLSSFAYAGTSGTITSTSGTTTSGGTP